MTQSEKKSVCVVIGTAHGQDVKGKCSPDKSLYEWRWSRMACSKIVKRLQEDGYRAVVDTEDQNEIGLGNRVQIVNNYCSYFGSKNVVYVSVHNNAAGADGKWKKATGWQCHVAKTASASSKRLASLLYGEAEEHGLKVRRPLPKQDYWENDFYVLKNTRCPAVLTENMFQDNKDDVEYLLSKEGVDALVDVHVQAIEKYVNELIVK